jgi:adenylate cyclase
MAPNQATGQQAMRVGIRLAISTLVLGSILVSAAGVHALWWRTAAANSRLLAATINRQIVTTVEKEIAAIDTEARSAHAAIRTLFYQHVLETREADKREFVFLAQLQAHPTLSWIAFGWPDGSFFAAHKLGDEQLEMMEISMVDGTLKRRIDRYLVVVGDIEFEERGFEKSEYQVSKQAWFRSALGADTPSWFDVAIHPNGTHPAIAFAGPIDVYQKREGVLAVVIERARLSRFLSELAVGQTGAAFILGPDGAIIAVPDSEADELHMERTTGQKLLAIASHAAAREARPGRDADARASHAMREVAAGEAYAVTLTSLAFPGWTLATVIPEREFLGPVEETTQRLLVGLLGLVVLAGLLSAWLARRIIAAPLVKVAAELRHVERFDLDKVRRHPSRLAEIDNLSNALADMANGLAAFRKYLPGDLVKMLVSAGVEARPGGSVRPMTVLFADIAGFTGLSERLGDRIVPLLGAYFDTMSREIQTQSGTIDKFIGDAVMAFWGAPAENPDHALAACRAALACQHTLGLTDDHGRPLRMRIGINSGNMLVGNIGSDVRLNYTVVGDAVNVASRLESANKQYGTNIIIGEQTRHLAGDRILVRELDRLAVYGRQEGIGIFELIAIGRKGASAPDWVALYEAGLAAYRVRNFAAAIGFFQMLLAVREGDVASRFMIDRCRALIEAPPGDDWKATTEMSGK